MCGRCGARRDPDDALAALTWVAERTPTGTWWLCPDCARRHVRDIEGKLPAEWW
ncbi:hypothetical protein LX15_003347 [Streptoalloteichus tenebrarius]|uniref:Uncharacterized protein n=1 Tax=Streptoalloteichus tenebrarius (strain ATCC 17920 / DSM 40477 / JCM 4838 / CBS 697.72 / NBRC 16177 / NCIMB 11028 / NRRL B-12390 / A12253. 1 / ISP 5477) TaxID=1933 RepID=A0ABT1HVZ6_STRSD|nr:hypothetical protein [Streptoalloteichus tenebrarius]BFF00952.1 hypothetical protein GCM10020241_26270 [Streptoalloteichus tenebrarius]